MATLYILTGKNDWADKQTIYCGSFSEERANQMLADKKKEFWASKDGLNGEEEVFWIEQCEVEE